jgi:hypothetical protein
LSHRFWSGALAIFGYPSAEQDYYLFKYLFLKQCRGKLTQLFGSHDACTCGLCARALRDKVDRTKEVCIRTKKVSPSIASSPLYYRHTRNRSVEDQSNGRRASVDWSHAASRWSWCRVQIRWIPKRERNKCLRPPCPMYTVLDGQCRLPFHSC